MSNETGAFETTFSQKGLFPLKIFLPLEKMHEFCCINDTLMKC